MHVSLIACSSPSIASHAFLLCGVIAADIEWEMWDAPLLNAKNPGLFFFLSIWELYRYFLEAFKKHLLKVEIDCYGSKQENCTGIKPQ